MFWSWLGGLWVSFPDAIGIAFGKLAEFFGLASSWNDFRSRRPSTLGEITRAHREVWEKVRAHPGSAGMFDRNRDLARFPRTDDETYCVSLVLNHFAWVFAEHRAGRFRMPAAIGADARNFFSYPVRRDAWLELRVFYDRRFVAFVERCLAGPR